MTIISLYISKRLHTEDPERCRHKLQVHLGELQVELSEVFNRCASESIVHLIHLLNH